MEIARFMATPAGRLGRVALGVIIITIGVRRGSILSLLGLAPIYAGAANVCLIAPFIGAPFHGEDAQRQAGVGQEAVPAGAD